MFLLIFHCSFHYYHWHFFFFFFFQAEDGIRDTSVTGVQTCALPIFGRVACFTSCGEARHAANECDIKVFSCPKLGNSLERSEERRVGKECRYGGAREE